MGFLSTVQSKTGTAGRRRKPATKSATKPAPKPRKVDPAKPRADTLAALAKGAAAPKSPARSTRKRTVPAAVVSPPAPESPSLKVILARLADMKAENPVVIDMRGRSLFSDHMVIATGRSNRHVASCAEAVSKGLKDAGVKKVHVEGLSNADWVLIDTGEVIVHVFRAEVREFYNLERLWALAPDALARPA